ncbi:MAG TPA: ATP-binding cassette domain-containing protein, partial [Polyangium sp.]|nr:ATP-binding cassette domain-containing protein [Polyangium sp.]
MAHAISIKGVTKAFAQKVAVNDLDLEVPEGSLYGFIGPNGAGKTTTIRMIMSIIFPDAGELSVLGRASAVESKDRIGYLPEERGIYRKMKAGPFLTYMARLKGVHSHGLDAKVKGWLDRVGLADCYKKRCEELSKGMQQKVQFIASIIHEPELIILDEPFSGLDPVNRRLLRSLIDEQHRLGRTIIFSTHAMFEAEQLCTPLVMIHQGHKVLDMPLGRVWEAYDPRIIYAEPLDPAPASSTAGDLGALAFAAS